MNNIFIKYQKQNIKYNLIKNGWVAMSSTASLQRRTGCARINYLLLLFEYLIISLIKNTLLESQLQFKSLLLLVLKEVKFILVGVPDALGVGMLARVIRLIFYVLLIGTVPHPRIIQPELRPVTNHIFRVVGLLDLLIALGLHSGHPRVVAQMVLDLLLLPIPQIIVVCAFGARA